MPPAWEADFYPVLVLGRIALSLSMRVPNSSPAQDKNRAAVSPEILSSTGAGVWRKAPKGFPDSSSALDKFQPARSLPGFYLFQANPAQDRKARF